MQREEENFVGLPSLTRARASTVVAEREGRVTS